MLNTRKVMSSWTVKSAYQIPKFNIRKHRMKIRVMSALALNSYTTIRRYQTKLNEESFMNGSGASYMEEMFNLWLKDRNAVHVSWDCYFKRVLSGAIPGQAYQSPPTITPGSTLPIPKLIGQAQKVAMQKPVPEISARSGSAVPVQAVGLDKQFIYKQQLLVSVITAYQNRGHLVAELDPLRLTYSVYGPKKPVHPDPVVQPQRTTIYSKISELAAADMDTVFDLPPGTYIGGGQTSLPFQEIINRLENAYCKHIGVEIGHIESEEISDWIKQQFEPPDALQLSNEKKRIIFEEIAESHTLDTYFDKKWNTQTRFGLEGGDSLIPGISEIINVCAVNGAESIIIGMPHRGRINVLSCVCKRPIELLFAEFLDLPLEEKLPSDVKYHLGSNTAVFNKAVNRNVNITMLSNPSHLEVVDPVAGGRVRAEQKLKNDTIGNKVVPLVMHGDAGIAGQGVVYENFNLAELPCYTTKGTIHIVVNNQIGYTTLPNSGRSSSYCTGVARMMDAPIFHVNSDSPEAVVYCCKVAAEFRSKFHRDVVIDMIGYRRRGHSETDDPKPTAPVFYDKIHSTKPVVDLYGKKLISEKVLSEDEFNSIVEKYNSLYTEAFNKASKMETRTMKTWSDTNWENAFTGKDPMKIEPTGVKEDILLYIGKTISTPPPGNFGFHKSAAKQVKARGEHLQNKTVTWALAEAYAFGSLLKEGIHVRLTGEDSERGTFHQRHHVYYNHNKETETYIPLKHLYPDQAEYCICNSPLTECACLGFEIGYASTMPNALVVWEAQYGDFANMAQPIIDNFIASGEVKWLRQCGIVVMLPHGMEGAGPEHSNARCERFLQLSSDDPDILPNLKDPNHIIQQLRDINWIVANCTTPANVFHILRRQVKMPFRKPLIFMTAKSLLRHPNVISPLSDLLEGTELKRVIPDDGPATQAPDQVERLIFCSGKAYFDIKKERDARNLEKKIAITRIEQLCPFPYDLVKTEIKKYPKAELCWGQEEHKNSGPWSYVFPRIDNAAGDQRNPVIYAGRLPSASPASGVKTFHKEEIKQYLNECLTLSTNKKPSPTGSSHNSPASAMPFLITEICTKYHDAKIHDFKSSAKNTRKFESIKHKLCFEPYPKSTHKIKKIYPKMILSKLVQNISEEKHHKKHPDLIFGSITADKSQLKVKHPTYSVCKNTDENIKSVKTTDIIFGSVTTANLKSEGKTSSSDTINAKQNIEPIKSQKIISDPIVNTASYKKQSYEGTTHGKEQQSKSKSESNICGHTKPETNIKESANQDNGVDSSKTKQMKHQCTTSMVKVTGNNSLKMGQIETNSSNVNEHNTMTLTDGNVGPDVGSMEQNANISKPPKENSHTEIDMTIRKLTSTLNGIISNAHANRNVKQLENKAEAISSNDILPVPNENKIYTDTSTSTQNNSKSQTEFNTMLSIARDGATIKHSEKDITAKIISLNEQNANISDRNKLENRESKPDLEKVPQEAKMCNSFKEMTDMCYMTKLYESSPMIEEEIDNECKQGTGSSEKSTHRQLAKLLVKTVLKCTPADNNSSMTYEFTPTAIYTITNKSSDDAIQTSDKCISSLEGKKINEHNDTIQWSMTVGLTLDKQKPENCRTQSLRKSSSEVFNRYSVQIPKMESRKSNTSFRKCSEKEENMEITACRSEERLDRCPITSLKEEINTRETLSLANIKTSKLKHGQLQLINNETIPFGSNTADKISEEHLKATVTKFDVDSILQRTLSPKPAPSLESSCTKTFHFFSLPLLDYSDIFEIENAPILTESTKKPKPARKHFKVNNINNTSSLPSDIKDIIQNDNRIKAIIEPSPLNVTQCTIKAEVLKSSNYGSEDQDKNTELERTQLAPQNTRSNSEISLNPKEKMSTSKSVSKKKTRIPRPVSAPSLGLKETKSKFPSSHEKCLLKSSEPKSLKTDLIKCKPEDPVPHYHKLLSAINETGKRNKTVEDTHLGSPQETLPKTSSLDKLSSPASLSQSDHEQFQAESLNMLNVNETENKSSIMGNCISNTNTGTKQLVSNVNKIDDHLKQNIKKLTLLNTFSDQEEKLSNHIKTNLNIAMNGQSITNRYSSNISQFSSVIQSAAKNMPQNKLSLKIQESIQKALALVQQTSQTASPATKSPDEILLKNKSNKSSHSVDCRIDTGNSSNVTELTFKQPPQDSIIKYTTKEEKIGKFKNTGSSLPLSSNIKLKGTETANTERPTSDLKLMSSQENKTTIISSSIENPLKERFEEIKEEKSNKLILENDKSNAHHEISVKLNKTDELNVEERGQDLTENNIQFIKTIFPCEWKEISLSKEHVTYESNDSSKKQNCNNDINENVKKICPISDETMMEKSDVDAAEIVHTQNLINKLTVCFNDANDMLASQDDGVHCKLPFIDIQLPLTSQNQTLKIESITPEKSTCEDNIQKISKQLLDNNDQLEKRLCTNTKKQYDINSNLKLQQKLDNDKGNTLPNHMSKNQICNELYKESRTSLNANNEDNLSADKLACTVQEHESNDTLNNVSINPETFEVIHKADIEWSSLKTELDIKICEPTMGYASPISRSNSIMDYLKKKYAVIRSDMQEPPKTHGVLRLTSDRNSAGQTEPNKTDQAEESINDKYGEISAASQSIPDKIEFQIGTSHDKQKPITELTTVKPCTKELNMLENNVLVFDANNNESSVPQENKITSIVFDNFHLENVMQQDRESQDLLIKCNSDLQNKEISTRGTKECETSSSTTAKSEFKPVNLTHFKSLIKNRINELSNQANSDIKENKMPSVTSTVFEKCYLDSAIQKDRESQDSISNINSDLYKKEISTKNTKKCKTSGNVTEESKFKPVNLSHFKSVIKHRLNQLSKKDNYDLNKYKKPLTDVSELEMANVQQLNLHVSEHDPSSNYMMKLNISNQNNESSLISEDVCMEKENHVLKENTDKSNLKINSSDVLNCKRKETSEQVKICRAEQTTFHTEENSNISIANSETKLCSQLISPKKCTSSTNVSPTVYDPQPKTIMCRNSDETKMMEAGNAKPQIVQSKEMLRCFCTNPLDYKIQNEHFHNFDNKDSTTKSNEILSGKCYTGNSLTMNQELTNRTQMLKTDVDKFKEFMLPTCQWEILKSYAFPTSTSENTEDEDAIVISSLPCIFESDDRINPSDNICNPSKSKATDKISSFCEKSINDTEDRKSYFVDIPSPLKLDLDSPMMLKDVKKERSAENSLNGKSKYFTLIEALHLSEIKLNKAGTQTNSLKDEDTELQNSKFHSAPFTSTPFSSVHLDNANTEGCLLRKVQTEERGKTADINENLLTTSTSSHPSALLPMIRSDVTVTETSELDPLMKKTKQAIHEDVFSSYQPNNLKMNSGKPDMHITSNLPMIISDGKKSYLTAYKESNNFICNSVEIEERKTDLLKAFTNYESNLPMIISDEIENNKSDLLKNYSTNLPMIISENCTNFPILTLDTRPTDNGNKSSDVNKKLLNNDENDKSLEDSTFFENKEISTPDKIKCLKMLVESLDIHRKIKNRTADLTYINIDDCCTSPLSGKYVSPNSKTYLPPTTKSIGEKMEEETNKENVNKPIYNDSETEINLKNSLLQPKDKFISQIPVETLKINVTREIFNEKKIDKMNKQLHSPIERTVLQNEKKIDNKMNKQLHSPTDRTVLQNKAKSINKKNYNPSKVIERKSHIRIRQSNQNDPRIKPIAVKDVKLTTAVLKQTSSQTSIPKKMSNLTENSLSGKPTAAKGESNIINNSCKCHLGKPNKSKITVPKANIKLSSTNKPYKTINPEASKKQSKLIKDTKKSNLSNTCVGSVNLNPKSNISTVNTKHKNGPNSNNIHQAISQTENTSSIKHIDKSELTNADISDNNSNQSLPYTDILRRKVQGVRNENNEDNDTKQNNSFQELKKPYISGNKMDSSNFMSETKQSFSNNYNNYNDSDEVGDMKYITSVKEVSDPKIPGAGPSIKIIRFNFIPRAKENSTDSITGNESSKIESSLTIHHNNSCDVMNNTNKTLNTRRMSAVQNNNCSVTTNSKKSSSRDLTSFSQPNSNSKRKISTGNVALIKSNPLFDKHKVLPQKDTNDIPDNVNKQIKKEALIDTVDHQTKSNNTDQDIKDYDNLYYTDQDDSKFITSSNETDDPQLSSITAVRFNFVQPKLEENGMDDSENNTMTTDTENTYTSSLPHNPFKRRKY